ncbi:MAG: hypothetical protein AAFV25_21830 [Bacteroidota bacterium]
MKTTPQHYLIKGDLSGIQAFIFNVQSDTAAQSLKGRSFFLKILCRLVMHRLFEATATTQADDQQQAQLSTAGGNFILRLPLEAPPAIDQIQRSFNQALAYTDLSLVLACLPQSDDFIEDKRQLDRQIRQRKHRLFANDWEQFEPFDRTFFTEVNRNGSRKKGKKDKAKNTWKAITENLLHCTHFQIHAHPQAKTLRISGGQLFLAGYSISFGHIGIPFSDGLEANIPTYQGRIRTFEELAIFGGPKRDGRAGIHKLGILKLDADDLGQCIHQLSTVDQHRRFDKALQVFFNRQLRELMSHPTYDQKIYVVTAGGDDSFFVGKWNTLLQLALDIQHAFAKTFGQDRPDDSPAPRPISLSAALIIVDPKFPVLRFAQLAEDALRHAKSVPGKGNIHLLGELVRWRFLHGKISELRERFNRFAKHLLTSGLLAKARHTSLRVLDQEGLNLSDYWKLNYYMRNFNEPSRRAYNRPMDQRYSGARILADYRRCLDQSRRETQPLLQRNWRLIFPLAARLAEFDQRKSSH